MVADFEAMYEEMGGGDEGEREGGGSSRDDAVTDPRASTTSKMVDLSSTRELVSQVSQEERGAEVATVGGVELMGAGGGCQLDAEEGELSSDSSSESGGVKRKVHVQV